MTYENLDEQLINALLSDGRASLRSLAQDLDVSVTTVSNHLSDLEEQGIVQGYKPVLDYNQLGYDVTAVMQLKVEGNALAEITDSLQEYDRIISVYETTGDNDIVAIGKFKDTDDMNDQIKSLLTDPAIEQSNTSIVLNTVTENEQFELDVEE